METEKEVCTLCKGKGHLEIRNPEYMIYSVMPTYIILCECKKVRPEKYPV